MAAAAAERSQDMVRRLLEPGADVNTQLSGGGYGSAASGGGGGG